MPEAPCLVIRPENRVRWRHSSPFRLWHRARGSAGVRGEPHPAAESGPVGPSNRSRRPGAGARSGVRAGRGPRARAAAGAGAGAGGDVRTGPAGWSRSPLGVRAGRGFRARAAAGAGAGAGGDVRTGPARGAGARSDVRAGRRLSSPRRRRCWSRSRWRRSNRPRRRGAGARSDVRAGRGFRARAAAGAGAGAGGDVRTGPAAWSRSPLRRSSRPRLSSPRPPPVLEPEPAGDVRAGPAGGAGARSDV